MNSLILLTSSRIVLPVAMLFSVYVLLRGHNEPGGGFVGGLIAAAGIAVHGLPRGRNALLRLLKVSPKTLIGAGLVAIYQRVAGPGFTPECRLPPGSGRPGCGRT